MSMDRNLLDDIINRLLKVRGGPGKMAQVSEGEIRHLCLVSKQIFLSQPNLLELEAPFKVCGDIHGQYPDLLRLFEYGGLPPSSRYLFMGNYVDYGKQSIETICLLLAYKIKYPEDFVLLRGNHECASVNRIYGFYDECKRRFNIRLWKVFVECFNCMPVVAMIDEKILCMHGGLSPELIDLDQIRNIPRPVDVPDNGLLCDLLWADPCREIKGWGMNDRDVSYTFGADEVSEFLRKHDIELICRSHQVVEDGYEFFADRQLVTIFSAPNFRGEYDNAGAMMSIDDTLMCTFQILKPADRRPKVHANSSSSGSSSQPLPGVLGTRATAAGKEKVSKPAAAPSEIKSRTANQAQASRNSASQPIRHPWESAERVASPPRKNKSGPSAPARENVKQATSPRRKGNSRPTTPARENVKQATSPPRKGKSRPVTPARVKQAIPTSTIKGVKSRPTTPARDNASRSVSPFSMECIRPRTPPRRSQTPFRKEQKH